MVIITKNIEKKKAKEETENAINILESFSKSLEDDANLLETTIKVMNRQYGLSDEQTPFILNQFLYFRVAFKDIVRATIRLVPQQTEAESNLNSRDLVVHLHSFMDTAKDFFGPKMREELSRLDDGDYLKMELQKLKTAGKIIKDDIDDDLNDVRHNTVAHKDKNALILSGMIKGLNVSGVKKATLQVYFFFSLIINFHQSILYSFKTQYEKTLSVDEQARLNEGFIGFKKPKGLFAIVKKMLFISQGMDENSAELLCDMDKEKINKIKDKIQEVIKYGESLDEMKKKTK